ncbi:MAG: hypothetical protein ABI844_14465 [Saprospiraceae bacterium]
MSAFIALIIFACRPHVKIKMEGNPITIRNAATPNLYQSPQKELYLTWTQNLSDSTDALYYSILRDSKWTTAKLIYQGQHWFTNWADFPKMAVFAGSELNQLAIFLQKVDTGKTYDYGVKLVSSQDNGDHFKVIDTLHQAGPGEHGFVSLLPFSFNKIMVVWLDGSGISEVHQESNSKHQSTESMKLMSAMVDVSGRISDRKVIDDKVCECCQTDLTMTAKGPLVVYRNRSDDEERDIYYSRYMDGLWTEPKAVLEDHWKIVGCPVNGPALAGHNNMVAVASYSEAKGSPTIAVSLSENAGENFKHTTKLNTKNTLGRLDATWYSDNLLLVTYLDKIKQDDDQAEVHLTGMDNHGKIVWDNVIDHTSTSRNSGFPTIGLLDTEIVIAYTKTIDLNKKDIIIRRLRVNHN